MSKARDIADSAATINALDGVTATGTELNILDGVTSTTAELNILDGVTSTAAELNILDGVTSTATELNILDGVTATTTELNYVDGVTSNIQTQLDNISVTNGTLTKTFIAGEQSTITLTSNVLVPNVSVTKEVAQTGSTNNDWLVNSSSENYTRYNSAAATTLDFNTYDVSTASFVDSFSISSQDSNANGLAFNADGTKMYVSGRDGDDINEYALSTAFDVSTASYTQNFSVSSQAAQPSGLSFNTDGTKMFVIDFDGDDVNEYALSTGFDISTASYTQNFSVSSKETQPQDVVFNSDGTKMFIVGPSSDFVHQYALSTGFDLSTASFTQSFDVGSQESSPRGLAFNPTGTKMFIVGTTGQDVNEYALTTAFDISTASYTQNFSVSSQDTAPKCIRFNTDGTKMFILGDTGDDINEYTLSIEKVTLGSGSFASADVGKVIEANSGVFLLTSTAGAVTQITAPTSFSQVASGSWQLYGLQFNTTDGDLELAGQITRSVAAATHLDTFDIEQNEGNPNGLTFKSDGTIMYVQGYNTDKILQYTLSTAFDLTTASYANKFISISNQDSTAGGLAISSDGTKIFFAGDQSNKVWEYTMSTAYDISTASSTGSVTISSQSTAPNGLAFNNDGTAMYVCDPDENDIFQYTLTTAYDISTASYASKYFYVNNEETYIADLAFNENGTKMYIVGHSNYIHEYDLSTAFDVSTASYNGIEFDASSQNSDLSGVFVAPDSVGKIYIVGRNDDHVDEYSILSATYPTTGYHAAHTNLSTDSTYWTDINSMTASESAGSGNIYYCVSTDDRTTWKIAKGTDGERNIAKNSSGTWQYNSNATYGSETWTNATVNAELYAIQEAIAYSATTTTTSGADDLAVVSLTTSKDVSGQTTGPEAITFNPAGTRMIVGSTSGNNILEYHLSTAFDLSTASYDSAYSVSGSVGRVDGVAFSSDGTHMYVVGYSSNDIHQFSLSTGFDISTASPVRTLAINSYQTGVRGVQINNNGTKIYTISDSDDQIEEWSLSTAYDISTASHESSTSISSQSGNAQGFCFNGDGTILFVCDESDSSGTVYQYSLSTAYDTSTLSYASKSYATGNSIAGVFVTSDGTKMFGAMNGDDTIKEYALQQTTSTTTLPNQMNKTQLDAIPDANHFTLANDLDLAIIMNQGSGATSLPSSDGVAINYDANTLNQGAVHGTDYTFDAPAQNKVRIKSINAANLKVRVV